jgi:hypothetical protein
MDIARPASWRILRSGTRIFSDCRARAVLVALVVSIAGVGCQPTVANDPNFYVSAGGDRERSTFVPTGGGWVPSSELEITLFAEPQKTDGGELFAANPRVIGTLKVDGYGMFGFGSGAFSYNVARSLCGNPPPWLQQPVFMARDKASGLLRFWSVANYNWFNFQPCQ